MIEDSMLVARIKPHVLSVLIRSGIYSVALTAEPDRPMVALYLRYIPRGAVDDVDGAHAHTVKLSLSFAKCCTAAPGWWRSKIAAMERHIEAQYES